MSEFAVTRPASVTITSALYNQKLPSISKAATTTICVVVSRMRVLTLGLPYRKPGVNLITSRCRFFL